MSKRFVSIWFPYLTTDWFVLKQPSLRNLPFVLVKPLHGRMIICAANSLAISQGIAIGMALADAKAILPNIAYRDDKPALATQLISRIAEWCIRFTPVASTDFPDGLLLDASGCSHLWGGDENYLKDISSRLAARGYTVRIAMAETVGAAWALTRFGKEDLMVTGENYKQAILPLSSASLRLEPDVVERLYKLGLHRVKDFIGMPRSALRRRFGKQMLLRLDQAFGSVEETLVPVYSIEPYQERLPCLEPIVTLTGIEMALQRMLESLCSRLRKESKGMCVAYFRGYTSDNGAQGIQIETSRPSHNETHLFSLFSLKFSTLRPEVGIELFVLEAVKVEEHSAEQESLWQTSPGFNDIGLAELIDRIGSRVGENNIYRFLPDQHHWPERSIKKAASLQEKAQIDWKTDKPRPVQLLQMPERIEVTAPIPDYPPMNFRYKGELHKIIKADGPERIEQEWWIQDGEHRDYYAVEDEEGRRYWLFRSGHYAADKHHQWFVHGFFA